MIFLSDSAVAELKVGDLVDAEDFGKMADVDRLTIHAYRKQPEKYGVPEPVLWAAAVPLWTKDQVREWLAARAGQGVGGGRSSWKTAAGE